LDYPFGFGIVSWYAPAGCRVLHERLPIPDEAADVDLVVQDAAAAKTVATDHRVAPRSTMWSGNPFSIKHLGYPAGRLSSTERLKDASHHPSLGLIDPAPASDEFATGVKLSYNLIAVSEPTGWFALPHAPGQTALHLSFEIPQEHAVHCALQTDMQLADFTLGERK
jgi:hypothetical protein